MKIWSSWRGATLLTTLLFASAPVAASRLEQPLSLEELARTADLACKATVIDDRPVTDNSFDSPRDLTVEVHETKLRVVSIVKGTAPDVIWFRHYVRAPEPTMHDALLNYVESIVNAVGLGPPVWRRAWGDQRTWYKPQNFAFTTGRTYLVFATQVAGGTYRELPSFGFMGHGELLAADAKPHRGTTVSEAVWAELLALLKSPDDGDVLEAVYWLDSMSGRGQNSRVYERSNDFDRSQALAAIQPLIRAKSVAVATAAVMVFGMDSPYSNEQDVQFWLVGIGKGSITGIGGRNRLASPLAELGANELLQVASDGATPELRAQAIRAHGRSRAVPAAMVTAWSRDRSIAVRRAAVLASADVPDRQPITTASTDASPELRYTTALAIGFKQDPHLLPLLDKLLHDPDAYVRSAAALSLLSFPPDQAAPVMQANLASDFRPLFVNALARGDPQPYVEMLAENLEQQVGPEGWKRPTGWDYGGTSPSKDSWDVLFDFVKSRPAAELTAGRFDRSLDALERAKFYGSGPPNLLYAFYVSHGMVARAKQFREATQKSYPGWIR